MFKWLTKRIAKVRADMASDEAYKSTPLYKHFISFKEGDEVLYNDVPANILRTTGKEGWGDDDWPWPEIQIVYNDKNSVVHKVALYPRDVLRILKHVHVVPV